ncbi:MAG: hypothetical protein RIR97_1901 [Pseudomonadota bacterium]|jgi:hypothetical protein
MTIRLTREQESWIREHYLADGSSLEDAVRKIVNERMAASDLELDDLAWVIPLLEPARLEMEQGQVLSLAEVQEQKKKLLESLQG